MAKRTKRRRPRQLDLDWHTWGGTRRNAGAKCTRARPGVPHIAREDLHERHPVHVTVRLIEGVPSLRRARTWRDLEDALRASCKPEQFRVAQYSAQSNHLHLIVEARDEVALARGMQGLLVRVARRLNRVWQRRGTVFEDRYHAHILTTPREVRSALNYVLNNARHHGIFIDGVDPFSSGASFDGWLSMRDDPVPTMPLKPDAGSWLLSVGWKLHGLLDPCEAPKPPRSRRRRSGLERGTD